MKSVRKSSLVMLVALCASTTVFAQQGAVQTAPTTRSGTSGETLVRPGTSTGAPVVGPRGQGSSSAVTGGESSESRAATRSRSGQAASAPTAQAPALSTSSVAAPAAPAAETRRARRAAPAAQATVAIQRSEASDAFAEVEAKIAEALANAAQARELVARASSNVSADVLPETLTEVRGFSEKGSKNVAVLNRVIDIAASGLGTALGSDNQQSGVDICMKTFQGSSIQTIEAILMHQEITNVLEAARAGRASRADYVAAWERAFTAVTGNGAEQFQMLQEKCGIAPK